MFMNQQQKMQVVSLRFVETGTYNPMYNRNYETTVTNAGTEALSQATQGGHRVNAFALAGAAREFISPAAQVGQMDMVHLSNGWDTRRLRFMAEIHYPSMAGGKVIQYVSGWTDHLGVSMQHSVDGNMILHFHNSILMQEVQEHTPLGPRMVRRITNAAHILAQQDWAHVAAGAMGGSVNPTRFLRPEDLMSQLSGVNTYGAGSRMMDMRQQFGVGRPIVKSNYHNGSLSQYVSTVMHGQIEAMRKADYDDRPETIFGQASGIIREDTMAQDNFLSFLSERQLLSPGGTIRYGELLSLDPMIDHVAEFYVGGQVQQQQLAPVHQMGQTAAWNGVGHETLFAHILAQSLPAAGLDNMLTRFSFSATNRLSAAEVGTLGVNQFGMGQAAPLHKVFLSQAFGLAEVGLDEMMLRLKTLMECQILPDVSRGNQIPYTVHGSVDVFGESRFNIAIDNGPAYDFCVPSFCDNLIVSEITTKVGHLGQVASDFSFVVDNIAASGGVSVKQSPQIALPSMVDTSGSYGF